MKNERIIKNEEPSKNMTSSKYEGLSNNEGLSKNEGFSKTNKHDNSFKKSQKLTKTIQSPIQEHDHSKYCRKHAKPKQDFTQMYFKEQGELARTLKQFILLDKEIEIMKKELCIHEDFELLSTFQIMDCKEKGMLSGYELEQALNKLELFPSKYELFLFIKRYDKDFDGKFSFSDYIESFVPTELRNIVQKRNPIDENAKFQDFEQVFVKL